jgi:hypothetical protein
VTPNQGAFLEVDEGNRSIGVAPNQDPSESDDDVFGDDVPKDGDIGSDGNEGDDGISTRRVVVNMKLVIKGYNEIQRKMMKIMKEEMMGFRQIVMKIKMSVIMC